VIQSLSDPGVQLYHRFYVGTRVGDKFVCVVVKAVAADAFVVTAFLTDTIKKGVQIWPRES
jgi:molybdopterin synthase catalytic subunit